MSTLITLTRHVNHEKMLIRRFLTAESTFKKTPKRTETHSGVVEAVVNSLYVVHFLSLLQFACFLWAWPRSVAIGSSAPTFMWF